jgi:hypothetical protein
VKKAIYKYRLDIVGTQDIEMPAGAKILCVQARDEDLFLWAVVDIGATFETRTFIIVGTGQAVDVEYLSGRYIGTVQQYGGVWHVFEKGGRSD